jgi:hypothetical protein
MKRVLVVAVALLVITPAAAEARSFTIKAKGSRTGLGKVLAIGDFKPSRDPSLQAALNAYGTQTSARGGGDFCKVTWRPLGLFYRFQNFGGQDSCRPEGGLAQRVVIKGSKPWHTGRGLALGDRVRKLKRLYPRAKRTSRGFRLVAGKLPFGAEPTGYAVLGARVKSGRVTAFTSFIGAAGD